MIKPPNWNDTELTIVLAFETYRKRNNLTDEWDKRDVQKGVEYAILTDEITKAWSGMKTREYKNLTYNKASWDYSEALLSHIHLLVTV